MEMPNIELDIQSLSRTYYFVLGEDFSQKMLTKFYDLMNSIGIQDKIEINLSSCGGDVCALFSLLNAINNNPNRFSIVVAGICDSAALFLILMSDCKKIFLPSFVGGVLHSIGMSTHTRDQEDPEGYAAKRYKYYKKLTGNLFNFCASLEIDETHIAKAKTGNDAFISREELIKAIKFKEKNEIRMKIAV